MRRPVVAAGIVLAAVAVGAAGWSVRAHLAGGRARCVVPVAAPEGPRVAVDAAPGGGGLRVVEQGFTNVNSGASFGAIVENTSSSVAYRTRVTFAFSNGGKRIALTPSPLDTQEIPIILPGQRIGVGTTEVLPSPHSATGVELRFGDTSWLTRAEVGDVGDVGAVTATVEHTEHPNPAYPGYLKVTYSSRTTSCRHLAWRGEATVVRNEGGAIIGGALDGAGAGCDAGSHVTHPIQLLPVPDDSRTQVFPYCDLQRPAETSTAEIAN